ncbi:VanZ family protein [Paenibacillus sp. N3/727]|uniref:VanZ family protein n=1 Tax=Paenibacillus sp. N3/727 TaxID=2925845 RepID=UPI001F53DA07|nr:VanZ family protein [Paenibacillus sp. N3/727]UNK16335.1 VanZ family protein [Paenibacillus sp. N3/727]
MKSWNKLIVLTLFTLYLFVLLKVILFKFGSVDIPFLWHQLQRAIENPEYMMNRLQSGNFTAFKSIKQYLHRLSSGHNLVNFIGNIVIFVPNGIFISLLTENKFLSVLMSSLGLSLGLECSQVLFSMGIFDVDDLILNVSGGLLGYGSFQIMKWVYGGGSVAGSALVGIKDS